MDAKIVRISMVNFREINLSKVIFFHQAIGKLKLIWLFYCLQPIYICYTLQELQRCLGAWWLSGAAGRSCPHIWQWWWPTAASHNQPHVSSCWSCQATSRPLRTSEETSRLAFLAVSLVLEYYKLVANPDIPSLPEVPGVYLDSGSWMPTSDIKYPVSRVIA